MDSQVVDHLFRHQYGKMIAVLTNFFGLSHLELIEDAVQDTFVKATQQWRKQIPENPEAWFIKSAKNRTIDLLRKVKADQLRSEKLAHGAASIHLNDLFLDHEIEDSQLRMIFVACHPELAPDEQLAFALKTISGFSLKEIAAALLTKEETIKKRLSRARKKVVEKKIRFEFPDKAQIPTRLQGVLRVIYLIFNEGFHSTKREALIDRELCGEALRLNQLVLKKEMLRSGSSYALFGLLCFHASRLESKLSEDGQLIDLESQDRSLWHFPLIKVGNDAMNKAVTYPDQSIYHLEAAIAAEHLKAKSFKDTNWRAILEHYKKLQKLNPSELNRLNIIIVLLQLQKYELVLGQLSTIDESQLNQRAYLLWATWADFHFKMDDKKSALKYMDKALETVNNTLEKHYLLQKRNDYL
ncbi:RNA polymerase sigma factor [Gilvibacter sediminis]|uniref:RNA polymerase sigma factor n=1 Tax=Gilvibacter sediminis TaxID=379071 RepID=UPI0023506436|nr:sigma-70 family RNA polymerase sigma factor [Gilvibacter sediminis]MDC7997534.1 sigma-70 family RNA polymerase sigma factor [Gilvibacter sediminis]